MSSELENLESKQARLVHLLEPFGAPTPEVFDSPKTRYRMRMEFRVWHNRGDSGDDSISYVMFEKGTKTVIPVEDSPLVCETISQMMPKLIEAVRGQTTLRERLFQAEFLANKAGELVITLIYHRPLDETWETAARELAAELGVNLIGRSRKQRVVIGDDFLIERFEVAGREFTYQQIENSFTQPNAFINERMLNWVVDSIPPEACDSRDLLELYCGNGNFTLPLATLFRRVLVTEISRSSIRALEHNLDANNIGNVQHARMSAEELSQAFARVRAFRRLQHVSLDEYRVSTILVDPPRAGVDDTTLALMRQFDHVVYISCNPETLAKNLASLCETHRVMKTALFNQFPGTDHVEAGVLLQRRALEN